VSKENELKLLNKTFEEYWEQNYFTIKRGNFKSKLSKTITQL